MSGGLLAGMAAPAARPRRPFGGLTKLIAVGASTGGVETLIEFLAGFPRDCPPTVVVQHMPQFFTRGFADRLDAACAAHVAEAWNGAPLERGHIWIAPGGPAHLEVAWRTRREVRLVESEPVNRHRPSVDVAFLSVAREVGRGAAGVLLTGMGRDGARGLLAMRESGARTFAQNRETSTVYGMPRAALEIGAVDVGLPPRDIVSALFAPRPEPGEEAPEWP